MHRRIKKRLVGCLNCGKKFHPFGLSAKYCSHPCFNAHRYKKGVAGDCTKLRKCKECQKEFKPWNFRSEFCSRECSYKFRRTISLVDRVCAVCGKGFKPNRKTTKFCSAECHRKFRPKGRRKDWDDMPKKGKHTFLDSLWADAVKRRAEFRCEVCDKPINLNAHHIFSRSNHTVRWDLDNGISLCVSHHVFGLFSAHKSPIEFVEWLKEKRGQEWYERLRVKAKMTIPDQFLLKENAKKELENKLSEYTQTLERLRRLDGLSA